MGRIRVDGGGVLGGGICENRGIERGGSRACIGGSERVRFRVLRKGEERGKVGRRCSGCLYVRFFWFNCSVF